MKIICLIINDFLNFKSILKYKLYKIEIIDDTINITIIIDKNDSYIKNIINNYYKETLYKYKNIKLIIDEHTTQNEHIITLKYFNIINKL